MHITYSSRKMREILTVFFPSTEPSTNQSQNERRGPGGEKRKEVEGEAEGEEISKKSVPEISIVFSKIKTPKFENTTEISKENFKNTQAIGG